MIKRWLRKYFSTLFVLATLMGVFHHHSDLQVHEDCQICTIQSNIADGDVPQETLYLTHLEKITYAIVTPTNNLHLCQISSSLQARAPPLKS